MKLMRKIDVESEGDSLCADMLIAYFSYRGLMPALAALCFVFCLVVGCGSGDKPASEDQVQHATNMVPVTVPVAKSRFNLYKTAFATMDTERFADLVQVDGDGVTHYRIIEDASKDMEALLASLEILTEAVIDDGSLDWGVDLKQFPEVKISHWSYVQHGGLITQWWVQRLIETGEIETAAQILSIGLKLAEDVALDRTLQGSILAMTLRDELCQVVAENIHRISPSGCGAILDVMMQYFAAGESWIARSFPAAVAEKDWFVRSVRNLMAQPRSPSGIQGVSPDIAMAFFTLFGYEDPLDLAILKGVPATLLTDDPEEALKKVSQITAEVGGKNLEQFLSFSEPEQKEILMRIDSVHKELGKALAAANWGDYLSQIQGNRTGGQVPLSKVLGDTPFLWNHATAWMKARKSEFMSRMKFRMALGGLAYRAGRMELLDKITNPINGSPFAYQAFKVRGEEKGYFIFVKDFDVPTYKAFSPFHQLLFITDAKDRYFPYGLRIEHKMPE